MYINPFFAGVLAAIMVGLVAIIALSLCAANKKK